MITGAHGFLAVLVIDEVEFLVILITVDLFALNLDIDINWFGVF